MSEQISRREFLKIIGLGAAFSAMLPPGSPLLGLIRRQLDGEMPGYLPHDELNGFATTCGGCPAGCGLLVQT